jgi:hypothetical protein
VNKQPGNFLLSPYIQSRKQLLGIGSQIFLVFAFSVADWECEAGLVLLSKVQWPFVLHILAGILRRIHWC